MTDCTDGTYTISLVASCSGEYRMVVSLDGQQVIGSPHMLSVIGSPHMLSVIGSPHMLGDWISPHAR